MRFLTVALVAVLTVACAAAPTPSATPSSTATATPTAMETPTAQLATPTPAPTATPSPEPTRAAIGLAHFKNPLLEFDYPAAWGEMSYDCGPSIADCENDPCFEPGCGITLITMSTAPFANPCHMEGNVDTCGWPIEKLGPNGVVAHWRQFWSTDFVFDPTLYPLVSAGGRTATWYEWPPEGVAAACGYVGGTVGLTVTVPDPAATVWSTRFSACISGPETDATKLQIRQMLQSIHWLMPADFQVQTVVGQDWKIRTEVFDPDGLATSVKKLDDAAALLLPPHHDFDMTFAVSHGGKRLDVAWTNGICSYSTVGLVRVGQRLVVTLDKGRPLGACLAIGIFEGISITLSDAISADQVELRDW